jgi:branched-chain amino acid transport system substrate-binding protein
LSGAIQRAGSTDPAAVRDELARTTNFQGVTGQISFDANRNASKPGLIVTVKDGKFEVAEKIAP